MKEIYLNLDSINGSSSNLFDTTIAFGTPIEIKRSIYAR